MNPKPDRANRYELINNKPDLAGRFPISGMKIPSEKLWLFSALSIMLTFQIFLLDLKILP